MIPSAGCNPWRFFVSPFLSLFAFRFSFFPSSSAATALVCRSHIFDQQTGSLHHRKRHRGLVRKFQPMIDFLSGKSHRQKEPRPILYCLLTMWHRDGPLLSIEAANKDSFRVDLVNGELPPAKRGRRRRATSRWDQQSQDPEQRAAVGRGHRGFPERMEGQLPPEVAHALAVRARLEELSAILTGEEPLRSEEGRAERAPSPPPPYEIGRAHVLTPL